MNFKEKLQAAIAQLEEEKSKAMVELSKLEEDFANVKLNPYGITSIDFTKRQELTTDVIKMEGTIMGLQLAIERFEEADGVTI